MQSIQLKNINQKENENETISELAHRHVKDETHTTTDEELKNAKVVLSQNVKSDGENLFEVDNSTVIPPLIKENDEDVNDEDNDKNNENDEKSLPNPYDILGG